jgi:UDP-glucose 4-epimerase
MKPYAWVVGARGLLGKATSVSLRQDDSWNLLEQEPLTWSDTGNLATQAREKLRNLLEAAQAGDGTWAVFWTAGTVVTSSSAEVMSRELKQFESILDAFAEELRDDPLASSGCIFYASSAGALYAGSSEPPFTEDSVPVSISGYGDFKLEAERMLTDFAIRTNVSSVSGRISNLYGPGQSLLKMQGLISHVAKAQYSPTPSSIYVPLDTLRDYIYVSDCAGLIADTVFRALTVAKEAGPIRVVKNLASGQAVTISSLLGYFRTLAKGHPHVMLGSSPNAALQALDLRIGSTVWPDLDERDLTPLPAGIQSVMTDILAGIQAGSASRR